MGDRIFISLVGGLLTLLVACRPERPNLDGLKKNADTVSQSPAPSSETGDDAGREVSQSKDEQRSTYNAILTKLDEAATCAPQPGLVLLRRLTNSEYRASVTDLLEGDERAGKVVEAFPPQVVDQGLENHAFVNVVGPEQVAAYWQAAQALADLVVEDFAKIFKCPKNDETCAENFIKGYGKRVYRRPLQEAEVAALEGLYRSGAEKSFAEGIRLVATALFNSPHFLYRSEIGEAGSGGVNTLSSYEVVTALSYFLTASTPSPDLLKLADAQPTFSEADIEGLATRLLSNPRVRDGVASFADAYMHVHDIFRVSVNTELFPNFDDRVREDMAAETRDFFKTMILDKEASFAELYTAEFTVTQSRKLQAIYGGKLGSDNQMSYNTSERLGLLGHGSFLAAHTHADSTSPVLRGAFVLENLLCDILVPPPPDLMVSPPKLDPNLTTQERFKAHSTEPRCAGCHAKIDGVGFGLESYDPSGAFRTQENNRPIDTKGALFIDGKPKAEFSGTPGLGRLIAESQQAKGCFVLQMFRHANGRPVYERDSCQIKKLIVQIGNDDKLKKLLVALLANYSFVNRKP